MELPPHGYLPHPARIVAVRPESAETRTFVLAPEPAVAALDTARPGQFVMLSVLGYGEAAFTLSALPCADGAAGTVVVTVRRVGALTTALFALAPGARVGVRGPFGRGFSPHLPARPTL
jgi:NAD(P)H-flavin reductase